MEQRERNAFAVLIALGLVTACVACGRPTSTADAALPRVDATVPSIDAGTPTVDTGVVDVVTRPDAGRPVQTPLASSAIPQFVNALPLLSVANGSIQTVTGNRPLTIRMCEFWASVLPIGTFTAGVQPKTRVWGYIVGNACPPNGPNDPALDTFTGPVILSARNHLPDHPRPPTTITWVNELGTTATTQLLAYTLSTDQTVHWADPLGNEANACSMSEAIPTFGSKCAANYGGPIPAVVHLHGGEVPPAIDGGPDAWFLSQPASGYATHGHGYYTLGTNTPANSAVYAYPNTQEAAPLFFHDHTLGVTRLSVYAGLAGVYLLTDPDFPLPPGLLPAGLQGPNDTTSNTIPLVIQARSFDTNGQFLYPADSAGNHLWATSPRHPYWSPEAAGDTIVVNGKAWPYLQVEPRRYRFLLLDGSDSRALQLALVNQTTGAPGPEMWVITTDDGLLDAPVAVDPSRSQQLLMMPGERYEVIVDFSHISPGTNLVLRNTAAAPYPTGTPPDPNTVGRVMQFRVGPCTSGACGANDPSYDPASGTPLRTGSERLVRFADPATGTPFESAPLARTRLLTLNEVMTPATTATDPASGVANTRYAGGPLEMLLNNTKYSGASPRSYQDFVPITLDGTTTAYSELPREGDAEMWEIVNLTADAHPIHTHLADMQIVNRQDFDVAAYRAAYDAAFPAATVHGTHYAGGVYIPGFGPPLDYAAGDLHALGGNPDVTPFLTGEVRPPEPYEAGWKDTVVMLPGQVTRVIVRFAPSDLPIDSPAAALSYPFDPSSPVGYVWHCHMLSHEDNEMMRPFRISLNPAATPVPQRPLQQGRDY